MTDKPVLEEPGKIIAFVEQPCMRDQFAMAALTGILSGNPSCNGSDVLAQDCYTIADAMLEQRSNRDE